MPASKYGKRYDRAKIAAAYQAGAKVYDLAERAGCSVETIYRHLRAAGVPLRDDRANNPGRPRTEACHAGHEWTEETTRVDRNGQRHCRPCEARKARDRKRRLLIEEFLAEQAEQGD